jgi:outer membrane protein assembly factor BamB
MTLWRKWFLSFAMLWVAACASSPEQPAPRPLPVLSPSPTKGQQQWSRFFDKVNFPLAMAASGNMLLLASDSGRVLALQPNSGRELWSADVGTKISAGVGSDGRFAAVVSTANELIVLDSGKVVWRERLPSSVVTAPLVAGERVFVLGVDRAVHAFDALSGHKIWTYRKPSEPLILAQPSVLLAFKDTLLAGQGAKLLALDPGNGTVRWEPTLVSPRGTNEVERLADLVGPGGRSGDVVCARAFQTAVACVNAERGSMLWNRLAGGVSGVAVEGQLVVGADKNSRITAWRTLDGSVAWTSEQLLYRALTVPVTVDNAKAFVVGDLEGFVHWISRDTGSSLLRFPTDGSAIRTAPVVVGSTTVVLTSAGGLFAFGTE